MATPFEVWLRNRQLSTLPGLGTGGPIPQTPRPIMPVPPPGFITPTGGGIPQSIAIPSQAQMGYAQQANRIHGAPGSAPQAPPITNDPIFQQMVAAGATPLQAFQLVEQDRASKAQQARRTGAMTALANAPGANDPFVSAIGSAAASTYNSPPVQTAKEGLGWGLEQVNKPYLWNTRRTAQDMYEFAKTGEGPGLNNPYFYIDQHETWALNNKDKVVAAYEQGIDVDGDGQIDVKGEDAVYYVFMEDTAPENDFLAFVDAFVRGMAMDPLTALEAAVPISKGANVGFRALDDAAVVGSKTQTVARAGEKLTRGAETVARTVNDLPYTVVGKPFGWAGAKTANLIRRTDTGAHLLSPSPETVRGIVGNEGADLVQSAQRAGLLDDGTTGVIDDLGGMAPPATSPVGPNGSGPLPASTAAGTPGVVTGSGEYRIVRNGKDRIILDPEGNVYGTRTLEKTNLYNENQVRKEVEELNRPLRQERLRAEGKTLPERDYGYMDPAYQSYDAANPTPDNWTVFREVSEMSPYFPEEAKAFQDAYYGSGVADDFMARQAELEQQFPGRGNGVPEKTLAEVEHFADQIVPIYRETISATQPRLAEPPYKFRHGDELDPKVAGGGTPSLANVIEHAMFGTPDEVIDGVLTKGTASRARAYLYRSDLRVGGEKTKQIADRLSRKRGDLFGAESLGQSKDAVRKRAMVLRQMTEPQPNEAALIDMGLPTASAVSDVPPVVQRFEGTGATPGSTSRPQGLYTTPSDVDSPYGYRGGGKTEFRTNPSANTLIADGDGWTRSNRGRTQEGAGLAALRMTVGDVEYQRLLQMPKPALRRYMETLHPDVQWKRFMDAHEILEAYGGLLARDAGYDAIWQPATKTGREWAEYVALTDNAFVDPSASALPTRAPTAPDQPAFIGTEADIAPNVVGAPPPSAVEATPFEQIPAPPPSGNNWTIRQVQKDAGIPYKEAVVEQKRRNALLKAWRDQQNLGFADTRLIDWIDAEIPPGYKVPAQGVAAVSDQTRLGAAFNAGDIDESVYKALREQVTYGRQQMTMLDALRTMIDDAGDVNEGTKRFVAYLQERAGVTKSATERNAILTALRNVPTISREIIMFSPPSAVKGIMGDLVGDLVRMVGTGHGAAIADALNPRTIKRALLEGTVEIDDSLSRMMTGLGEDLPDALLVKYGRSDVSATGKTTLHQTVDKLTRAGEEPGVWRDRVTGFLTGTVDSRWAREARGTLDNVRRRAVYKSHVMQELPVRTEAFKDFGRDLAESRGFTPESFDGFFFDLENKPMGAFSPDDVRLTMGEMATQYGMEAGAAQAFADELARAWKKEARGIRHRAQSESNRVLFSYQRTNLDDQIGKFVFFHYWMSRAFVAYAEMSLKNPEMLAIWVRMWSDAEQTAEDEGYPDAVGHYIRFMGSMAGYQAFNRSPLDLILPYSMFWEETPYTPDGENWLDKIAEVTFITPILQSTLAAAGVVHATPDPFGLYAVRGTYGTVVNYMRAKGLFGDDARSLGPAPYQEAIQKVYEVTSGAAEAVGLPFAEKRLAKDPQGQTKDEISYVLRTIIEQDTGMPYAEWGDTELQRFEDAQAAILAGETDNLDANEAFDQWATGRLTGRILGGVIPGGVKTRYGPRDTGMEANRAGDPVEGQFRDQAMAGSETAVRLISQKDQYDALGTERQRGIALGWRQIAYADFEAHEVVTVGGRIYDRAQLEQLTDKERYNLADAWVREVGGTDEYADYKTKRDAFVAANPDLKGYETYKDGISKSGLGQPAWVEATRRGNPNFDAYLTDQEERWGTDPVEAAFTPDAYLAYLGESSNVYDALPGNVRDMSRVPYNANESAGGRGGSSFGGGSFDDSVEGRATKLAEDIAAYTSEMAAFEKYLPKTVSWESMAPSQRDAYRESLKRQGIEIPSMPARVQTYYQWTNTRKTGEDTSYEAFIRWMDEMQSKAAA